MQKKRCNMVERVVAETFGLWTWKWLPDVSKNVQCKYWLKQKFYELMTNLRVSTFFNRADKIL